MPIPPDFAKPKGSNQPILIPPDWFLKAPKYIQEEMAEEYQFEGEPPPPEELPTITPKQLIDKYSPFYKSLPASMGKFLTNVTGKQPQSIEEWSARFRPIPTVKPVIDVFEPLEEQQRLEKKEAEEEKLFRISTDLVEYNRRITGTKKKAMTPQQLRASIGDDQHMRDLQARHKFMLEFTAQQKEIGKEFPWETEKVRNDFKKQFVQTLNPDEMEIFNNLNETSEGRKYIANLLDDMYSVAIAAGVNQAYDAHYAFVVKAEKEKAKPETKMLAKALGEVRARGEEVTTVPGIPRYTNMDWFDTIGTVAGAYFNKAMYYMYESQKQLVERPIRAAWKGLEQYQKEYTKYTEAQNKKLKSGKISLFDYAKSVQYFSPEVWRIMNEADSRTMDELVKPPDGWREWRTGVEVAKAFGIKNSVAQEVINFAFEWKTDPLNHLGYFTKLLKGKVNVLNNIPIATLDNIDDIMRAVEAEGKVDSITSAKSAFEVKKLLNCDPDTARQVFLNNADVITEPYIYRGTELTRSAAYWDAWSKNRNVLQDSLMKGIGREFNFKQASRKVMDEIYSNQNFYKSIEKGGPVSKSMKTALAHNSNTFVNLKHDMFPEDIAYSWADEVFRLPKKSTLHFADNALNVAGPKREIMLGSSYQKLQLEGVQYTCLKTKWKNLIGDVIEADTADEVIKLMANEFNVGEGMVKNWFNSYKSFNKKDVLNDLVKSVYPSQVTKVLTIKGLTATGKKRKLFPNVKNLYDFQPSWFTGGWTGSVDSRKYGTMAAEEFGFNRDVPHISAETMEHFFFSVDTRKVRAAQSYAFKRFESIYNKEAFDKFFRSQKLARDNLMSLWKDSFLLFPKTRMRINVDEYGRLLNEGLMHPIDFALAWTKKGKYKDIPLHPSLKSSEFLEMLKGKSLRGFDDVTPNMPGHRIELENYINRYKSDPAVTNIINGDINAAIVWANNTDAGKAEVLRQGFDSGTAYIRALQGEVKELMSDDVLRNLLTKKTDKRIKLTKDMYIKMKKDIIVPGRIKKPQALRHPLETWLNSQTRNWWYEQQFSKPMLKRRDVAYKQIYLKKLKELENAQVALPHEQLVKEAERRAVKEVQRIVFSFENRYAGEVALRNVVPFGTAYREIMTYWIPEMAKKPTLFTRGLMQGYGMLPDTMMVPYSKELQEHLKEVVKNRTDIVSRAIDGLVPDDPDTLAFHPRSITLAFGSPGLNPLISKLGAYLADKTENETVRNFLRLVMLNNFPIQSAKSSHAVPFWFNMVYAFTGHDIDPLGKEERKIGHERMIVNKWQQMNSEQEQEKKALQLELSKEKDPVRQAVLRGKIADLDTPVSWVEAEQDTWRMLRMKSLLYPFSPVVLFPYDVDRDEINKDKEQFWNMKNWQDRTALVYEKPWLKYWIVSKTMLTEKGMAKGVGAPEGIDDYYKQLDKGFRRFMSLKEFKKNIKASEEIGKAYAEINKVYEKYNSKLSPETGGDYGFKENYLGYVGDALSEREAELNVVREKYPAYDKMMRDKELKLEKQWYEGLKNFKQEFPNKTREIKYNFDQYQKGKQELADLYLRKEIINQKAYTYGGKVFYDRYLEVLAKYPQLDMFGSAPFGVKGKYIEEITDFYDDLKNEYFALRAKGAAAYKVKNFAAGKAFFEAATALANQYRGGGIDLSKIPRGVDIQTYVLHHPGEVARLPSLEEFMFEWAKARKMNYSYVINDKVKIERTIDRLLEEFVKTSQEGNEEKADALQERIDELSADKVEATERIEEQAEYDNVAGTIEWLREKGKWEYLTDYQKENITKVIKPYLTEEQFEQIKAGIFPSKGGGGGYRRWRRWKRRGWKRWGKSKFQQYPDEVQAAIKLMMAYGGFKYMPDEYKDIVIEILVYKYKVWDNRTPMGELISQLYKTPKYKRQEFMQQHPELAKYFRESRTPEQNAMFDLANRYFSILNKFEKRRFIGQHPELTEWFEEQREKREKKFLRNMSRDFAQNPQLYESWLRNRNLVAEYLIKKYATPPMVRTVRPR